MSTTSKSLVFISVDPRFVSASSTFEPTRFTWCRRGLPGRRSTKSCRRCAFSMALHWDARICLSASPMRADPRRRFAHLGSDADPSPARALHRAWRRALARWGKLDRVPAWVLPARARPLYPVSGRVSGEACRGPQGRAPAVLLRSGALGGEERIFCLPCPALADRLGGRLQATLCRA